MCGIAGAFLRDDKFVLQISKAQKTRALELLKSRGPDDAGCFEDKRAVLLHTRLSIIGLKDGRQPMQDHKGRVVVYNGEIYNYPELKEQLKGSYNFQTSCDTEIILALYDQYGSELSEHLRGMYAFALYDPEKNELLVSRDPFGIKPLYLFQNDKELVFASEIKALEVLCANGHIVDPGALKEIADLNYLSGGKTAQSTIQRLLPGESRLFKSDGSIATWQHTALPCLPPRKLSQSAALKEFDLAILETVEKHCLSDVGYGLFLSGGLDSSSLALSLRRLGVQDLNCYTASFDVPDAADESAIARQTASDMGFTHRHISFDEKDFWRYLPLIAEYMDDPVADYAILPTWKLAEHASTEQKVVLSGEGGDEMLAGYGRYRSRWWQDWRKLFQRRSLSHKKPACESWTPLQHRQATDFQNWLPNDLLIKLDSCLMAHGVEGRTPFLDKIFAQKAFLLPDNLKVKARLGKYLQRLWLNEHYPSYPAFQKKQGFTVPVGAWIEQSRKRSLNEIRSSLFIRDALSKKEMTGLQSMSGARLWPYLYMAYWAKSRY